MKWELKDLTGSKASGGDVGSIRVREEIPETALRSENLVVIFAEDWFDYTKTSIGGNQENRASIVFVGYIMDGTIRFNYAENYVEFDVASATELMKMCEAFSVSVEDVETPTTKASSDPENYPSPWMCFKGLTVKKATYHYMKWHSTVLKSCDYQFLGTDQKIQYFDADRTSLYDAVNVILDGALVGGLCSDAQGKMWAEIDIFIETPDYINEFYLQKQDWVESPSIESRRVADTSYIEAGGIAYIGYEAGGTSTPLLAAAPGQTPGYRGRVERLQGLALVDQTHLNLIAGRLYANANKKNPRISFEMGGNFRNFDVAPQQAYYVYVPREDNPDGTAISKYFFVEDVSFSYEPENEQMRCFLGLSEVPVESLSETLVFSILDDEIPGPTPINTGTYAIPPFNITPITLPPFPPIDGFFLPIINIPPFNFGQMGGGGASNYYLRYNGNISGASTTSPSTGTATVTYFIDTPGTYTFTPVVYWVNSDFDDDGNPDEQNPNLVHVLHSEPLDFPHEFSYMDAESIPIVVPASEAIEASGIYMTQNIAKGPISMSNPISFGFYGNHTYGVRCLVGLAVTATFASQYNWITLRLSASRPQPVIPGAYSDITVHGWLIAKVA